MYSSTICSIITHIRSIIYYNRKLKQRKSLCMYNFSYFAGKFQSQYLFKLILRFCYLRIIHMYSYVHIPIAQEK